MSLARLKQLLEAAQREVERLDQAHPQRPAGVPRIRSFRKLVKFTTDRLLRGDVFTSPYFKQLHRADLEGFVSDVLAVGGPLYIADAAEALRSASRVSITDRSCYRIAEVARSIAREARRDCLIDDRVQARFDAPRVGRLGGRGRGRPASK